MGSPSLSIPICPCKLDDDDHHHHQHTVIIIVVIIVVVIIIITIVVFKTIITITIITTTVGIKMMSSMTWILIFAFGNVYHQSGPRKTRILEYSDLDEK